MGNESLELLRVRGFMNDLKFDDPNFHDSNINAFRFDNNNCLNNNLEDAIINQNDLCRAMSFKGNIVGYANSSLIKNLSHDIISHIDITNMQQAKFVLITCFVHSSVSIFTASDFVEEIRTLFSNECEIEFRTQINNTLDKNTIQYNVLLTGITNSTINLSELEINYKEALIKNAQLEDKYSKLLSDYAKLKNLNERLQLSMLSLKKWD